MNYPETPQHDLVGQHKDEIQAVADFLEWLAEEKEFYVAQRFRYRDDGPFSDYLVHASWDKHKIIAEFFGIDYAAYLKEKDEVLEYVRSLNNA